MVRYDRWKCVHYVGHRPRLFDLGADPQTSSVKALPTPTVRARLRAELKKIADPDAMNAQASADQEARIAADGGPEAIKPRGDFGDTPAPGQIPMFVEPHDRMRSRGIHAEQRRVKALFRLRSDDARWPIFTAEG